jgi:hypothetical protein
MQDAAMTAASKALLEAQKFYYEVKTDNDKILQDIKALETERQIYEDLEETYRKV